MAFSVLKHPILRFLTRTEVLLFLVLWLSYGMLINAKNVEEFGQATIEAIVDQRQFNVETLPVWPDGDSFGYFGHIYSNKQPGQALLGAIAYAPLKLFGITYAWDKVFTGGLVIFLSASLLAALAGVFVFLFARDLDDGESTVWPLAAALVFGFGTIQFAYSGIAHHDVIATAFLLIGFYLLFRVGYAPNAERDGTKALLGGLFLGLTLTTSMLHFFMVVIVGLYFVSLGRWRLLKQFFIGGVLGVLPIFIYNYICFGNPLLMPALANYKYNAYNPEVFFFLDWNNFIEKKRVYILLVNQYMPILWFGLVGLLFVAAKRTREVVTIVAAIFAIVFFVLNIEGLGTCAYGPRYILPMLPFAAIGIIGVRRIPAAPLRVIFGLIVAYVAYLSFKINLVGAMGGAMYCNMAGYAYPDYLARLESGTLVPNFMLAPYLLPIAVITVLLVILKPLVSSDEPKPAVAE